MQYRTVEDLLAGVRKLAHQIGPVRLVVGVPRSGLLAATMYALTTNTEVTDLESYAMGRAAGHGLRELADSGESSRVLVLDDSVLTGREQARVRSRLESSSIVDEIVIAAVFASRASAHLVDAYAEVVEAPRIFEWNLFHHPVLSRAGSDIDGVLCVEPPADLEFRDAEEYRAFIAGAQPLILPTVPLDFLITNRLEIYRRDTERWLSKHGVRYGELIMRPEASAAARIQSGMHSQFKASWVRRRRSLLFLESDSLQAQYIANAAGIPVFCTDSWTMCYPGVRPLSEALVVRPATVSLLYWTLRARLGSSRYRLRQLLQMAGR